MRVRSNQNRKRRDEEAANDPHAIFGAAELREQQRNCKQPMKTIETSEAIMPADVGPHHANETQAP